MDLSQYSWLLGPAITVLGWFRLADRFDSLGVEVHRATVQGDPRAMAVIRVTNRSARDVVVTRIWFDTMRPGVAEVVWTDEARRLPRRLQPRDRWETYWALENLDALDLPRAESLACVQISTGTVFKSRATRDVAPGGVLAGS